MPAAAHFVELKLVHDLAFGCFVNVFLGQINDLFGVHAARHLQAPHFAEIVLVFVGDDVAAGEALDGDDHCDCCWYNNRVSGFLIVVLWRYF